MSFKVYKQPCKNCLLSKDRIVSGQRAQEIIQECAQNQTYFICHKSSMKGGAICCKTFFDNLSHLSKLATFAKGIGAVQEVEQTDCKKLKPYRDATNEKTNH